MRRGRPPSTVTSTYDFAKIPKHLHEIEKKLLHYGGSQDGHPNPPMV